MPIQVGQIAPDFTLTNTDKQPTTLSALKGKKVVLLFFPAAFTGVCTAELCSVRDGIADYNTANAEVFGISTDTVFSLIKFKEEQKLNFHLLSDFNKDITALYEVAYESFVFGMVGNAKRSAFVIDENGVVTYAEVLESAGDLPNFQNIHAALK
jgi:peroxiredoxin